MSSIVKIKAVKKIWDYQACLTEAKKYKSRWEFQKNNKYPYIKSLKEGWINDYTWLSTPVHVNGDPLKRMHFVYSYEDSVNKAIYIGRTINVKQRHNSHNRLNRRTKKYDAVKTYFNTIGIELPLPKILKSNLTLEESQFYEDYYVKLYKENGWIIINRAKTGIGIGSAGGFVYKLTYEYCKEESLGCQTRREFEKKNSPAYAKSCREGWIEDFIPYKTYKQRSYRECESIAKRYTTKRDFRKNDLKVYNYSKRKGWLKNFTWIIEPQKVIKCKYKTITKDEVLEYAKQCMYKTEFRNKYYSYYRKAVECGWINELTFEGRKKYTYEYWYNIVKDFDSKQSFRKAYPVLVNIGYINGWFTICGLFNNGKRKLTKEKCLEIASKYEYINDLRKHDESVYGLLLNKGWLKLTNLKYKRNRRN